MPKRDLCIFSVFGNSPMAFPRSLFLMWSNRVRPSAHRSMRISITTNACSCLTVTFQHSELYRVTGHTLVDLGLQVDRDLVLAEDCGDLCPFQPGCVYKGTHVWELLPLAQTRKPRYLNQPTLLRSWLPILVVPSVCISTFNVFRFFDVQPVRRQTSVPLLHTISLHHSYKI